MKVLSISTIVALVLLGAWDVKAFLAPTPLSIRTHARQVNAMMMAASVDEYKECKAALEEMIDKTNSNPIMIRLAWHDSGTFDKGVTGEWPAAGGAVGSIRFSPEIEHGANAGLTTAIKLLTPIKNKFPNVSWADLMQMASAAGVELAGGPKIPMKYGRVDVEDSSGCSPEGNLPGAAAPFDDGCNTPQEHLRKVFYRMGFNDQEIVALSGAHTLGRAWKDRSGFGAETTKYTDGSTVARGDGKEGIGAKGGSAWTEKWLKFDNSYYQTVPDEGADPELLKLETDTSLFLDEGFLPTAQKYKSDQDAFFEDYAAAHAKLSELGSKFEPAEGVKLD
uniref:Plant heme peroxidase family profile domain-containing protein n=1 Tax=Fibrocapsa japonica TaxID=94617 RepID=A0A7S2V2W5_9STRA|eukprot:CAMPEP_0113936706 /NCGR_PEP_ID=MMETSP1339-20121228/3534_1 /TAXON_ID=94617 /ORGANISM="Fibrocapsa japonica" /LENGTH=334 /DNA_ID=CAMNT_0000939241 /DNA_START=123 /DNA_END=1127 /DNA_ORIENTATION=- /assembly_acc=CAM_ASM_000762